MTFTFGIHLTWNGNILFLHFEEELGKIEQVQRRISMVTGARSH